MARKPAHKTRMVRKEFDVDLTLFKNRQIFLFEDVNEVSTRKIIKELFALDAVNHEPIMLYINSPGGDCALGFAIINTMQTIESPVVTINMGEASSISGHISVSGNKRVCYENSAWMEHDIETYFEGTGLKLKDRSKFIDSYSKILNNNLRQFTNLSERDIKKAEVGELWLFADQMLEKGVVDEIIVAK